MPEHRIRCGVVAGAPADSVLLSIDGRPVAATFRVSHLSKALVANLPDVFLDLLELAAYVYAADAAIRRGGPVADGMGKEWRRRFHFTVPVRRRAHWQRAEVLDALRETLGFLSDDSYQFEFIDHDGRELGQGILVNYGEDDRTSADEVILFSGGLDSFAGAAEALLERQCRVALVSHHSAPFTKKVQATLVKALRAKTRPEAIRHFCLEVKTKDGQALEGTHRTRSFLFAALGSVVAWSFNRDRIHFYENGIVSLNLAPLEQFVGGRATRSTHPLALSGLTRLFAALLEKPVAVRNPYLWRTKADIIAHIRDLGIGDLLPQTHSCANVRIADRMTPHCGRCSQCIDRRFAVLAAGCEDQEPPEMYGVDLLRGPRLDHDRELALAYVRNARAWRAVTPMSLIEKHPEVTRVLAGLDVETKQGLKMVARLCSRHGQGVTEVMEQAIRNLPEDIPVDSLAALYAADDWTPPRSSLAASEPKPKPFLIEVDKERKAARLGGTLTVRAATYATLAPLVEVHLANLGTGRAPEDFTPIKACELMDIWELADEDSARRRILRLRRVFDAEGLDGDALIENLPWKGYRLNPEAVIVRRVSLAEVLKPTQKGPK